MIFYSMLKHGTLDFYACDWKVAGSNPVICIIVIAALGL